MNLCDNNNRLCAMLAGEADEWGPIGRGRERGADAHCTEPGAESAGGGMGSQIQSAAAASGCARTNTRGDRPWCDGRADEGGLINTDVSR